MKILGWEVRKSDTSPHPDNRANNLAWFNREFSIEGEYKPSDGENSSIVAANVNWLTRSLLVTPLRLYSGEREIPKHPILDLLQKPNSRHTYRDILYGLIRSLIVSGDGIIEVLDPLGLQLVPYQWLRQRLPRSQGQIPGYFMWSWTDSRDIDPTKVAHLMWAPYDRNQTIGESPLVPCYPDLLLDRAAMEGAIGRLNSPIPGLVMSPKTSEQAPIRSDDRKSVEEEADDIRGYNAGRFMLIKGDFNVQELTGATQRFSYKEFHELAESRISSVLGIHPRALYLGAGLHQSQGFNSQSLDPEVRISWKNGVKPMGALITEGLNRHLLPLLGFNGLELRFDFESQEMETEEEKKAKQERIMDLLDRDLIGDEQALEMLGMDPTRLPEIARNG